MLQGTKDGSLWNDYADILRKDLETEDSDLAEDSLELIKWLNLPVLSRSITPVIKKAAHKFPDRFIKVSLDSSPAIQEELKYGDIGIEWFAAIREILFDFKPNESDSFKIIDYLNKKIYDQAEHPYQTVHSFSRLNEINPLLMYNVLNNYPFKDKRERNLIICFITNQIASVNSGFSDAAYNKNLESLLYNTSITMGVDDSFISNGIIKKISDFICKGIPMDDNTIQNFNVALNIMPFRKYLALRLLELAYKA